MRADRFKQYICGVLALGVVAGWRGDLSVAGDRVDADRGRSADRGQRPVIPTRFAEEDAVILRWEQTWSGPDAEKATRYHELKHVLIQNDRALRAFADPRITYNKDYETIRVITARTVCPDGRVVGVPEYSRNEVSPRSTAGWPAFSSIRQMVLSFGGIEPGAVIELEWERTTAAGMHRYLEVDARLNGDYPTLNRVIRHTQLNGPKSWTNLPANRGEAQSIPWRERCDVFSFTDCPDRGRWIASVLEPIEAAVKTYGSVSSVAEEWSDGKSDALDKAFEIQDRLSGRFNFVAAPAAWTSEVLRPVGEIMSSNHGSGREAAALLLGLFRGAGLNAEPFFATAGPACGDVRSAIADFGVCLEADGETTYWHASSGRIRDPGAWGGRERFPDRTAAGAEGAATGRFLVPSDSGVNVSGTIDLKRNGTWTAKLDIKAKGLFVPARLGTEKQKRSAVESIAKRVLPDAELKTFTIKTLSDTTFALSAKLKSKSALEKLDGDRLWSFPKRGPWTEAISIPLNRSARRTSLRLAGPFEQTLDLVINLPKDSSVTSLPSQIDRELKGVGEIRQSVSTEGDRVRFRRTVAVRVRDIPPEAYASLREGLSVLRTDRARTLVLNSKE
ncbi:MAG: DUF3857 domain-containing protein [Planctomycetota bacterium]|nr:DUF3857 domain-containing protein [Planctomycetota bacterium]